MASASPTPATPPANASATPTRVVARRSIPISRCENRCRGCESPTPEGLSLNSRGCARHERTPGNATRNARHPGGVVPSPRTVGRLGAGRTPPGFAGAAAEVRGVARAPLHPRLFTMNPAGVRPQDASNKWIRQRLRRPQLAMVLLVRETTRTIPTARTFAKIDTPTTPATSPPVPQASPPASSAASRRPNLRTRRGHPATRISRC